MIDAVELCEMNSEEVAEHCTARCWVVHQPGGMGEGEWVCVTSEDGEAGGVVKSGAQSAWAVCIGSRKLAGQSDLACDL